jgi:hypothetical protein
VSEDAQVPSPAAPVPPPVSQEFYLRVNDFIQMANRIERRHDTHHAQLAMLHGLARYSAHHYRTTSSQNDVAGNREAFADYIGVAVKQLVLSHLEDMAGTAPADAAAVDVPSDAAVAPADNAGNDPANDAG